MTLGISLELLLLEVKILLLLLLRVLESILCLLLLIEHLSLLRNSKALWHVHLRLIWESEHLLLLIVVLELRLLSREWSLHKILDWLLGVLLWITQTLILVHRIELLLLLVIVHGHLILLAIYISSLRSEVIVWLLRG